MITESQKQERIKFIGSSDAAAACGMSRWKTPLQLWAEKTGQIEPEDISGKLHIKLGNRLEQVVAELFMEETGKKVHRVNETITHPNFPFLCANLDRRVVGEDAILECKTAGAWAGKEWSGEEIPSEVIVQVMHQLAVTGKSYGYAAVLIGGNQDFKWKRVDRDPILISQIIQRETDFWLKYVEPKVMPAIIKAGDSETLESLFPGGIEKEIELDSEGDQLAQNVKAMQADYMNLKDMIEADKNKLKKMLGNHNVGTTANYKISWKPQKSRRLDIDSLREKEPELCDEYTTETSTRVMRITEA